MCLCLSLDKHLTNPVYRFILIIETKFKGATKLVNKENHVNGKVIESFVTGITDYLEQKEKSQNATKQFEEAKDVLKNLMAEHGDKDYVEFHETFEVVLPFIPKTKRDDIVITTVSNKLTVNELKKA